MRKSEEDATAQKEQKEQQAHERRLRLAQSLAPTQAIANEVLSSIKATMGNTSAIDQLSKCTNVQLKAIHQVFVKKGNKEVKTPSKKADLIASISPNLPALLQNLQQLDKENLQNQNDSNENDEESSDDED
jgi:hypothetical protein